MRSHGLYLDTTPFLVLFFKETILIMILDVILMIHCETRTVINSVLHKQLRNLKVFPWKWSISVNLVNIFQRLRNLVEVMFSEGRFFICNGICKQFHSTDL